MRDNKQLVYAKPMKSFDACKLCRRLDLSRSGLVELLRNFENPPKVPLLLQNSFCSTAGKLSRKWLFCLLVCWCSLAGLPNETHAFDLTNYYIRLDHVTYLTRNLDSLTRAFQRRGFTVTPGDSKALDVERHFVNLPDGTYLELQSTASTDTSDWRIRALNTYGDHIASVTFQTPDLSLLRAQLEADSIQLGETLDEKFEGQLLWRAFGIQSSHPLDIVFIQREQNLIELPIQHDNGHRRIEWIIFATSQEVLLRKLFASLDLKQRHEGWFDYWMMGSPEARLNVRIGPPYNPFFAESGGIFIEENGLVFAY